MFSYLSIENIISNNFKVFILISLSNTRKRKKDLMHNQNEIISTSQANRNLEKKQGNR